MELENKYAGSEYNSFCEYFCELTEFLDNITEKKRLSRRHYILGLSCDFADGVLPIRLPGSTVGGVLIDKDNIITKVQIDGNYYKDIYPKDINKMLERYVGERLLLNMIKRGGGE